MIKNAATGDVVVSMERAQHLTKMPTRSDSTVTGSERRPRNTASKQLGLKSFPVLKAAYCSSSNGGIEGR